MSYDLLLLDSYSFHYSVSLNLICHTDRGTQVRSRLPITTDSALPSTALLPSLGTRKRGRVEDYPNGGDLAVLDGEVFGRGNALGGNGVRVVEQQRGLVVAEGGNQRRTGEHLCESHLGLAHELRNEVELLANLRKMCLLDEEVTTHSHQGDQHEQYCRWIRHRPDLLPIGALNSTLVR